MPRLAEHLEAVSLALLVACMHVVGVDDDSAGEAWNLPLWDELEVPSVKPSCFTFSTGCLVFLLDSLEVFTISWDPSSASTPSWCLSVAFAATSTTHDLSTTLSCLQHRASSKRNLTSPCLSLCFHSCCPCPCRRSTSSFRLGTATPPELIHFRFPARLSGT